MGYVRRGSISVDRVRSRAHHRPCDVSMKVEAVTVREGVQILRLAEPSGVKMTLDTSLAWRHQENHPKACPKYI